MPAQFLNVGILSPGSSHVRHRALISALPFPYFGYRLLYSGTLRQHALDVAQLNTEAAQLHLLVVTTEILDISVIEKTRQIPCPVHAVSSFGTKRIGDEPLCGEVGLAKIPARQTLARQVQLARHPDGHWLMVGIEDVDLSVRNRSPDGHRLALFNQRVRRVRRVLRGTVQVVDFAHAGFLVNLLYQAPGKWFP